VLSVPLMLCFDKSIVMTVNAAATEPKLVYSAMSPLHLTLIIISVVAIVFAMRNSKLSAPVAER
jgi:hypothetical protein